MTPDRWSDLIEKLESEGKVESRTSEEFEGRPGSAERVIVTTPMGQIRLSWTTEPKKLSQKAFYSKRGGSTVNIKAEYDDADIIHVFSIERFDPSTVGWVHIDPESFSSINSF